MRPRANMVGQREAGAWVFEDSLEPSFQAWTANLLCKKNITHLFKHLEFRLSVICRQAHSCMTPGFLPFLPNWSCHLPPRTGVTFLQHWSDRFPLLFKTPPSAPALHCLRPVVLKCYSSLALPEGLVQTQIAGFLLQSFWFSSSGGRS